MKKFAVIVAGGSGVRMGGFLPKQFLSLHNKPLIWHSVTAFINAYADINIIVVLPKNFLAKGKELLQDFANPNTSIQIVEGGATRFHSVQNGLNLVEENSVVFVHDAVRCLVSIELIKHCYEQTLKMGSAIPCVTATDSLRLITPDTQMPINRELIKIVQTPQTFLSNIILPAFKQNYNEAFTDEATVAEAAGNKIFLCNGDYNNIKITRPIDLVIAEKMMQ